MHRSNMDYTQIVLRLAVAGGYAIPVARRIVEAVLDHGGNGHSLQFSPSVESPEIDTSTGSIVLDLGDVRATIAFEQLAPRIVVLDDFLTDQECDAMCDESEAAFIPSAVIHEAGHERCESSRNSSTALLARSGSPLIARIETRIERLTGWAST